MRHTSYDDTVGALGEDAVIRAVTAPLGVAEAALLGPGDDCAVLKVRGDLVVTTDTMIEGTDFNLAWHDPVELGWKLAATNLSDVAAMGAKPTGLTSAIACPKDTPVSVLHGISEGLNAACDALAPECNVIGGDVTTSPVIVAAITALGELSGRPPVTRSGAKPGDVVAYAGELGLSGLGLSALFERANVAEHADGSTVPLEPQHGASTAVATLWAEQPAALAAHLAPTPPIPLGVAAANAGATAMIDASDSLSLDASRIARSSGVTLHLAAAALREHFGTQHGVTVPVDMMLTGGEDHGLLATFPAGAKPPRGFCVIGQVEPQPAEAAELAPVLLVDGAPYEPRGWDPFK